MVGPRTKGQRERNAKLSAEERQLAERLTVARQKLRDQFGRPLSLRRFGELFLCDEYMLYKLEVGLVRIWSARQVFLEILEEAMVRGDARTVWGPDGLTAHQRLARLCRIAYPEAAA